jgi:hypothetical protein
MKETVDLNEEMRRGQEAKRLLESPLMQDVRQKFLNRTFQAFQKASADDVEGLQKIKVLDTLTKQFFEEFAKCVQTGHLAAIEIDKQKRTQRR